MRHKWMFIVPAAVAGMALFIVLGGVLVQWLWNWLLPPLFGWRTLSFWQALALLALCRILFGSMGLRGGTHSHVRRRMADRMADRVADRWGHMTPEERERFRQRIRERLGFDPASGPAAPGDGANPL